MGDLAVSRSLGDVCARPYVTHKPEINRIPLTEDVDFIVMACDGVWDTMSDQAAVDFVLSHRNPESSATALRDRAYLAGSMDNISTLIIHFGAKDGS